MNVADVPERRVDCDGIEIAYWIHGEGLPLLLITGLATPAASWGPFPSLLGQMGYSGVVVENRDVGKSSPCDGIDYSMVDMANDTAAVLDDAGIDQTYVLGISMGGMIAQELALNYPERVKKLILMATWPGRPAGVSASPEFLASLVMQQPGEDRLSMIQKIALSLVGPKIREEHPERLEFWSSVRTEQGPTAEGFSRQWQAIAGFGTWDRLPNLNIPTMVIHGTADPLVPYENGELLASQIPGAEFVTLDGVGHLVPLEAPEEILNAIARFFPVEAEATVSQT